MPDAPAASSAATVESPAPPSLESLSSSELTQWKQTGHLPERSSETQADPSSSPAASTPAQPAEQVASTDAPKETASEPVKPKTEARFQELLTERSTLRDENASLKARLAALEASSPAKPDAQPAESSTAPAKTLQQTISQPDVAAPMLEEDQFFAVHPEAKYGDYARYVAKYELAADRVRSTEESARQTRFNGYKQQIDAYVAANPDFLTSLNERVATLQPAELVPSGQRVGPLNVLASEIVDSPVAAQLLAHFSANPAELDRFAAMRSPAEIARALGRVEAKLDSSSAPPQPVVKTTTSAPPPPTTLGRKPSVPGDEVTEAVMTGDFAKFKAIRNRQDSASA